MPIVDYQPLARGHAPQDLVDYVADARKAAAVRYVHLPPDLEMARFFFAGSLDRAHPNAKPLAHIAISWPIGESPSIDEAFAYGEAFLERLGFPKQPALLTAHDDATHRHIHIMLDRVAKNGKVLGQERLAERIIDIRDELAREFGYAELGRNLIPTSNKIETAEAWNGRRTFTKYVHEKLRRERPRDFADFDRLIWKKFRGERVPGPRGGFHIEYHGSKTYYAKGSTVGFPPKRTAGWVPSEPLGQQADVRPEDTYDAFLSREESLTDFAKAHPKRLEFERLRRRGENVGQLGRFLRSSEAPAMDTTTVISDLTPEEQRALDETRNPGAAKAATGAPSAGDAQNKIGAGVTPPPGQTTTENRIGGPTAASAPPPPGPTDRKSVREAYRAFLENRGASTARANALVEDAGTLIGLRREANKNALNLVSPLTERYDFVESLRALGAHARMSAITQDLAARYSGQRYIGIDAFANLAAKTLGKTPEELASQLASRGPILGIDPDLGAMSALADLSVTRNKDNAAWEYQVAGSKQTFEERDDRALYFARNFDNKDTRTLDAALLAAAAMHGGKVEITGEEAFITAAIARAAHLGIEVTNHRERFGKAVAAERATQSKALEPQTPNQTFDPGTAAQILSPSSTSLREERQLNPDRVVYKILGTVTWNQKPYMLLRDSEVATTEERAGDTFFGEVPESAIALRDKLGVGDLIAIEGDHDNYRITTHTPDPERIRLEEERNRKMVEELTRQERQRDNEHTR